MSRAVRRAVGTVFFVALCARWSLAQSHDPAAAESLFLQGRAALDAGDYDAACAKLAESQRLEPAAGTLVNLAICEDKQGKSATAWQHLREAIGMFPPADERKRLAENQLRTVEAHVGKVIVARADSARAARITRDGVELGEASFGVPLPVDSGVHRVVVALAGHADKIIEVTIQGAALKTVVAEPGEALPPAPAESSPPPPARPVARAASLAPWALAGLSVAALTTGAIAGTLVLGEKPKLESHCTADHRCDADGLTAADEARTWGRVATAAFVVGAVAGGAAVWLYAAEDRGATTASIRLRATPGGLLVDGRY